MVNQGFGQLRNMFRGKVMLHHYGVLPIVGAVITGGIIAVSYSVYALLYKPDVQFSKKGRARWMNVDPTKSPYIFDPKKMTSSYLPLEDNPRRKFDQTGYEPQEAKSLKEELYVTFELNQK